MARAGIPLRRLEPLGSGVTCLLSLPGVAETAQEQGITRSRAAVLLAGNKLAGSILAVGNAPTTLLALLELLDAGAPRPALVIGMPVGFVNAAESKALLLERRDLPSIVLSGRRGGSPLAAAAVNALAILALAERRTLL
jgi:precorrin-8X/cobalt-precorrin-8 methylmutase